MQIRNLFQPDLLCKFVDFKTLLFSNSPSTVLFLSPLLISLILRLFKRVLAFDFADPSASQYLQLPASRVKRVITNMHGSEEVSRKRERERDKEKRVRKT